MEKVVSRSLSLSFNIKLEVQVVIIDNVDWSIVACHTTIKEKVINRMVRELRSSGDCCGGWNNESFH